MLRFILLLSLFFVLTKASKLDRNDPRIIDLSKNKMTLRRSVPKPKNQSIATRSIKARMAKTKQKLETNAEIQRLKMMKMKKTALRGLKLIERVLVQSKAIELNDKKKIVKIDPPQVKNVRNLLATRIAYNMDKMEDNQCGQVVDFAMRAGLLDKEIRHKRQTKSKQPKGISKHNYDKSHICHLLQVNIQL